MVSEITQTRLSRSRNNNVIFTVQTYSCPPNIHDRPERIPRRLSMIVSNLNLNINNCYKAKIVIPPGGWLRWSGKCTRTKTGVEREWNETLTGTERKLMGRWRDVDG
jgi:hypothetical protein